MELDEYHMDDYVRITKAELLALLESGSKL